MVTTENLSSHDFIFLLSSVEGIKIPPIPLLIFIIIVFFVLAIVIYISCRKIKSTKKSVDLMISEGKKQIEDYREKLISDAKESIKDLKDEVEKEIEIRNESINNLEEKINFREKQLISREEMLDRRSDNLDKREDKIDEKKEELSKKISEIDRLICSQVKKLEEISSLTQEEACSMLMDITRDKMKNEVFEYIKSEEDKAVREAKQKAKNILSLAIQKYSADVTSENTISTVSIPNDDIKGRIIGREGRNIRTFEALTGVDILIDDTPNAIVLSGFDLIRRHIAKSAIEILVQDGRIHPARIEEVVDKCRNDVENIIREKGEEAVYKTGIGKIHPDLVKLLGRLYFRTSYSQNVLNHSIETAMIAGKLAAEIGENEILARRAGLLHDIGKACDHEIEGSHVDIGVELCTKYHEPKEVMDAIASHHEIQAPRSIIAVLVSAADALSSSRPGARADSIENYIKRLEALEKISNSISGVQSSYAIQAGREIRVIVNPEEVDDMSTFQVARLIREEIESKLSYPGTIKVTVIREKRAIDVAK